MSNIKKVIYSLLIIALFIKCNNDSPKKETTAPRQNNIVPFINYTLVKTYPHDINNFTEGFLFYNDKLYESTGSPNDEPQAKSTFGILDLSTGKFDKKVELDKQKYFGEGIVILNDKIYQLTYKNQIGFIYNLKNFKKVGTFSYKNKEGWGLTTDGKNIIMSDGTNTLTYLNPENLEVIKTINITYNSDNANYINELEYINGFVYANIWTTNYIAKIDLSSNKIIGLLDLSELYAKAKAINPNIDVLNGIAFDSKTDKIYVTGKFWPFVFQIDFKH